MSLETLAILEAAESHAVASGHFERVNRHEPKNAPGHGLSAAIWVQRLQPVALASGLAATSVLLTVNVRLYTPMIAEPQDAIDPHLVAALDGLMGAYSTDFTLDGLVRNVDLLGQHGEGLSAQASYQTVGQTMFRVMTITLPLVISDVWTQVP